MTNPVTHLLWGYLVSRRLDPDPKLISIGLLMSVLPDIDGLPIPGLEHHGPMHTPLFVLVLGAVLFLVSRSRLIFYIGTVNLLMHLVLDTVGTAAPVMWLYPLSTEGVAIGTAVGLPTLIAIKLVLLATPLAFIIHRYIQQDESPLDLMDYYVEALGRPATYALIALAGVLMVYIGISEYLLRII